MIRISTDGACKGNPGPGGWGVAVFEEDTYVHGICGGDLSTTNNKMELYAFIVACNYIKENLLLDKSTVIILTDSRYVMNGCISWMANWVMKEFRGVKNPELWSEIYNLRDIWLDSRLTIQWVKGHSGDLFNEMADDLANEGYRKAIALS